jgi:hypothetical protein
LGSEIIASKCLERNKNRKKRFNDCIKGKELYCRSGTNMFCQTM